ncbi:PREDICTED: ABC transporter G family member 24 isoform X2 [Camelina sativa]|uniref:ABC transporter G family member 24 isoform X2 n=2 Tax=Camelina sativa TaxID=90675 RepID=A0ABM0VWT7_CAMSA|nr:PREDICTED: ABC transporter G family member 24 isoform X2 [Camelina sativa]
MNFNASQVTMVLNLKMSVKRRSWLKYGSNLRLVILVLWLVCYVGNGQTIGDTSEFENPAVLPLVTQMVYSRLSNSTAALNRELGTRAKFCIKDPDADWNKAFNFSTNLDFLSSCIQKTKGDIGRRICTAAEMKFYFNAFFNKSNSQGHLQPNVNCNLTSWVSGCEPGWGCSVEPTEQVDLQNSKDFPERTENCMACCEGFFCPRGLTCMIPCPLGAHCPLATLNKTTSLCEPYTYQLPPGRPNHTCGGANVWADIRSSGEVFCSAGSYCPTTTQKVPCDSGHYCRMGSTSEKPCFKLTSCNPNTANQNMHAFGVMVIAGVSTILLIIYNCSDQILTTREKRQAKSREAAVKKAKANQRWKAAREATKKHVSEIRAQINRTFSGKKSNHDGDTHMMLGRGDSSEIDEDIDMSKYSSPASSSAAQSSYEIEDDAAAVSNERARLEAEEKRVKRQNLAKTKKTRSQIFKYAYDRIEKEKAMEQANKNLTFSGIVAMATNTETRKRTLMELSFRDLTLTLKSNGKHVLRCVTGIMKPGRITAVMGPSGAGKTSLLSALAGKAVGCKLSGSILINGKPESIHSYKKIIGFVPQDDVVHGNLTVEENLWFHAKCRLPAGLSKADKVLVVERIIDSLGLQAVRNSIVGTVEKRGISGGQRKRVNVGLEMVMEPSVLFLDEPTSGLDSASSQLLLRALRHEALEGVNICMVVHQPSYTLFKTFNDLVLLAKGGLIVYHGSVNNVEEYFSGLGINVPDRINPPDYYIDVLEGVVISIGNSGVGYKELPQRWMLHKGYSVPLDMRNNSAAGLETNPDTGNQTFATELWGDVYCNFRLRSDNIRHNFLKSRDLSHRRTPSMWLQYKYFLGRIAKQRMREAQLQATDYLILLLAGACLGSLIKASDESFGAPGYTYTIIAVSLLCKIAALRSFSLDKLHYWRESASGMSSSACFLAKDTIDFFNILVKPLVYLSMFYFFTNPRSTFFDNYIVLVCLVYCVTGIAYALAIFLQPSSAQLFSVLLPVVLTLVATQPKNSEAIRIMADLSYPKWALEAFVIGNAQRYYGVWMITRCGSLMKSGYDINEWNLCIMILLLIGVATRGIAFVGMIILQKK